MATKEKTPTIKLFNAETGALDDEFLALITEIAEKSREEIDYESLSISNNDVVKSSVINSILGLLPSIETESGVSVEPKRWKNPAASNWKEHYYGAEATMPIETVPILNKLLGYK